jgi:phage pi2 protein 07
LADENYRTQKKAAARRNAIKKQALYTAKTKLLNQSLLHVTTVERHRIDDGDFLCLYFEDDSGNRWSFHQPTKKIQKGWLPEKVTFGSATSLDEFVSEEAKSRSDMPLKATLLHLQSLGYCANDHLEDRHVYYGSRPYYVGWQCLGEWCVVVRSSPLQCHQALNGV